MSSTSTEVIQTTLGELIEAVAQVSLTAGKTEEEGYKLASLALQNILKRNSHPIPQKIQALLV